MRAASAGLRDLRIVMKELTPEELTESADAECDADKIAAATTTKSIFRIVISLPLPIMQNILT